jgi:thioredoxin-dependent peroxiredoxin
MRKSLKFERLENRRQMASDWMNVANPLDVNSSGEVTPLDVLLIVNDVNQAGSRELPSVAAGTIVRTLVDVNGDGAVSPVDAWKVVNALQYYSVEPMIAFSNASSENSGSIFDGRTLPDTKVTIEQLASVLPLKWTFTADANGEFQGFDVGFQSKAVRVTAVDPLGRVLAKDMVFSPGEAEPTLTAIAARGPAIGDMAPEVALLNQNGELVSLKETLKSGPVVLYFYPKDNTPKCTVQAQDFRDKSAEMQALGVTVLGVSVDPVESHLEFANQYSLNFDILADDSMTTSTEYGVLSQLNGKPIALRTTYLIGSDGVIREIFRDVDVSVHGNRVLDALRAM